MNRNCAGTVLAFLVLLQGCLPYGKKQEVPEKYREFYYDLDFQAQLENFRTRPLDEQYELYLIQVTYIHPPMRMYASELAKRGSEIVPFLLEKLRTAESESYKEHTIYVIRIIAERHDPSIASDPEVIDGIRDSIETITPRERHTAQRDLDAILEVAEHPAQ